MKLFGIIESVAIPVFSHRPIQIQHPELFEHLKQYNTPVSVGLELVSKEKETTIKPITFVSPEIYHTLLEFFEKRGNKIIFLESYESYHKVAALAKKINELEKALRRKRNNAKIQEVKLDLDKTEIEYTYIAELEKEKYFLENIVKNKPDLVFLGAAHAARFYKNQEQLRQKYGITINEYWEEAFANKLTQDDILFAMSTSSEHISMDDHLDNKAIAKLQRIESPEQAIDVPEDTFIERMYKAVVHGRVTDGNPDFIGTWDEKLEHRGLFELYITKKDEDDQVQGTIEDCLGSATFEGWITKREASFTQNYTKAIPQAAKGEIVYSGFSDDAQNYAGDFKVYEPERGSYTGSFRMKRLKPSDS